MDCSQMVPAAPKAFLILEAISWISGSCPTGVRQSCWRNEFRTTSNSLLQPLDPWQALAKDARWCIPRMEDFVIRAYRLLSIPESAFAQHPVSLCPPVNPPNGMLPTGIHSGEGIEGPCDFNVQLYEQSTTAFHQTGYFGHSGPSR